MFNKIFGNKLINSIISKVLFLALLIVSFVFLSNRIFENVYSQETNPELLNCTFVGTEIACEKNIDNQLADYPTLGCEDQYSVGSYGPYSHTYVGYTREALDRTSQDNENFASRHLLLEWNFTEMNFSSRNYDAWSIDRENAIPNDAYSSKFIYTPNTDCGPYGDKVCSGDFPNTSNWSKNFSCTGVNTSAKIEKFEVVLDDLNASLNLVYPIVCFNSGDSIVCKNIDITPHSTGSSDLKTSTAVRTIIDYSDSATGLSVEGITSNDYGFYEYGDINEYMRFHSGEGSSGAGKLIAISLKVPSTWRYHSLGIRIWGCDSESCNDPTLAHPFHIFLQASSFTIINDVPECGNGILEAGETCENNEDFSSYPFTDDPGYGDGSNCSPTTCQKVPWGYCGDGIVQEDFGEKCDYKNDENCSHSCENIIPNNCGNGIKELEYDEECDSGSLNGTGSGCTELCQNENPAWISTSNGDLYSSTGASQDVPSEDRNLFSFRYSDYLCYNRKGQFNVGLGCFSDSVNDENEPLSIFSFNLDDDNTSIEDEMNSEFAMIKQKIENLDTSGTGINLFKNSASLPYVVSDNSIYYYDEILVISHDIKYSPYCLAEKNCSVLIIVDGDVKITSSVEELDAFIIAKGSIVVE